MHLKEGTFSRPPRFDTASRFLSKNWFLSEDGECTALGILGKRASTHPPSKPIGISARTVVRGTNQSAVPPEGLIKKFFSNNGELLLLGQASKLVAARAKCEECLHLPPSLSVPFFRAVAPMQFVRPLRLLTFAAAQRQIGS